MSRPKQLAPSTGAQSAEIDAEWLTKLLEKNKVVRSGPSPKPERIATAAKKLSSARFVAEVQSKVRNETGPLYTKATEALHALRETLPLIALRCQRYKIDGMAPRSPIMHRPQKKTSFPCKRLLLGLSRHCHSFLVKM